MSDLKIRVEPVTSGVTVHEKRSTENVSEVGIPRFRIQLTAQPLRVGKLSSFPLPVFKGPVLINRKHTQGKIK